MAGVPAGRRLKRLLVGDEPSTMELLLDPDEYRDHLRRVALMWLVPAMFGASLAVIAAGDAIPPSNRVIVAATVVVVTMVLLPMTRLVPAVVSSGWYLVFVLAGGLGVIASIAARFVFVAGVTVVFSGISVWISSKLREAHDAVADRVVATRRDLALKGFADPVAAYSSRRPENPDTRRRRETRAWCRDVPRTSFVDPRCRRVASGEPGGSCRTDAWTSCGSATGSSSPAPTPRRTSRRRPPAPC